MTPVLQIGNRTIAGTEIVRHLASYRMLPSFLREFIIDQAIAGTVLDTEETDSAIEQFYETHQLTTPEQRAAALKHYGMTSEQLELAATRELRIEKFKIANWGSKLESYFLTYKSQLDQVIYSLIRTQEMEVAQELYFRIQAGEQTFAECANEYSLGNEAQTGGLIGPVPLEKPHPAIAQKLVISQPGQLWPPMRVENWIVLLRLEKRIGAQLDDAMRLELLNHLFEQWLTQEISNTQLTICNDDTTSAVTSSFTVATAKSALVTL